MTEEMNQGKIMTNETAAEKAKFKKTLIVAIICVLAVALVACVVVLFVKNEQDHTPVPVSFSFEAANYDLQTGSGVPLSIEGTDLDGNSVSEIVLADEGSADVELLRGTYDISVVGSPVNGEGGIYAVPEDVMHLEISKNQIVLNDEAIQKDSEGSIELPTIKFESIKAQDITDQEVDAIKTWMINIGFSGELVTKFEGLISENKEAGVVGGIAAVGGISSIASSEPLAFYRITYAT